MVLEIWRFYGATSGQQFLMQCPKSRKGFHIKGENVPLHRDLLLHLKNPSTLSRRFGHPYQTCNLEFEKFHGFHLPQRQCWPQIP